MISHFTLPISYEPHFSKIWCVIWISNYCICLKAFHIIAYGRKDFQSSKINLYVFDRLHLEFPKLYTICEILITILYRCAKRIFQIYPKRSITPTNHNSKKVPSPQNSRHESSFFVAAIACYFVILIVNVIFLLVPSVDLAVIFTFCPFFAFFRSEEHTSELQSP